MFTFNLQNIVIKIQLKEQLIAFFVYSLRFETVEWELQHRIIKENEGFSLT